MEAMVKSKENQKIRNKKIKTKSSGFLHCYNNTYYLDLPARGGLLDLPRNHPPAGFFLPLYHPPLGLSRNHHSLGTKPHLPSSLGATASLGPAPNFLSDLCALYLAPGRDSSLLNANDECFLPSSGTTAAGATNLGGLIVSMLIILRIAHAPSTAATAFFTRSNTSL